jgi:hypothetical protein
MLRPRILALLLALVTLAVYLPASRFDFVNFDDNEYITENPFVRNGLTGTDICWAFTAFHAGNWHPLTWLSHMTDCELFQLNPGAHHLVNIAFHAANVALLFGLVWRLTRALRAAAFIAALFAWHPLHVESVAWISERKDVLSTFFALLSLLSYVQFVQEKSRRGYWLALFFFALGLMAKPMLVTLPCVMLLLDFWPLGRKAPTSNIQHPEKHPSSTPQTNQAQASEFGAWIPPCGTGAFTRGAFLRLVLEKWPFFALTTASCLVTFIAQQQGEAVVSLARVPLSFRLENAPVAIVDYLFKLFWPAGLCAYYPMPNAIPLLRVVLSVALLLLISAAAWHWRRCRPYFLVGWLWFLGTLVPVIGLLQVGGQAMADRYTYIPSIGFFLALVFLARDLAGRVRMPRIISTGLMVVIATACILVTRQQIQSWRDGETLFRRILAVDPRNDVALIDLGVALNAQGRPEEALVVYQQAEKINPARYQLHNNLGNILRNLGRHADALAEYRQGIALRTGNAGLHFNAGAELATLGRFDEALNELSTAEQCDPRLSAPHLEAAKLLFKQGRDSAGVEEFRTAVRLDPGNYQTLATVAHYLSASENDATRDGRAALPLALKANELSGNSQPVVFDILGMALAENGDFTNAIICTQNALTIATTVQLQRTDQIRARLELYRQHLPWRESFRATNAPGSN